jgi:hypothetical protein
MSCGVNVSVTDPKCIVMECMFETLEPKEEAIVDTSFTLAEETLNIDTVSVMF